MRKSQLEVDGLLDLLESILHWILLRNVACRGISPLMPCSHSNHLSPLGTAFAEDMASSISPIAVNLENIFCRCLREAGEKMVGMMVHSHGSTLNYDDCLSVNGRALICWGAYKKFEFGYHTIMT